MEELRSGDWDADTSGWEERIAPVRAQIAGTSLAVLVWGAGYHSLEFPKRKEIIDHLKAMNPRDQIFTSEELVQKFPDVFVPGLHPYIAEEYQWNLADLVVAIVPKLSAISGVRAELAIFGSKPDFLKKVIVVVPKLRPSERQRMGFLDQGWASLPTDKRFDYTPVEYRDCQKIRSFCQERVAITRVERVLLPIIHRER